MVVVLLAVSLFASLASRHQSEQRWRRSAALRVADALVRVSGELGRLEAISRDIARSAREAILAAPDALPAHPVRAFAILDSVLSLPRERGALPRGAQIGVQLLGTDGRMFAWAGWPRQLSTLDRVLASRGKDVFYTRRVSLYRILTHVVPVRTIAGGEFTLVIDLPLEVNYRVNNRFLKSGSFADNVRVPHVAEVTFDYFPTMGNLPERLERYRSALDMRVADYRRRRARRARAGAHDDSVLTDAHLPDNVVPSGEVSGDAERGLGGRVIVHASQGNPLLGISIRSHPFAHDAGLSARRMQRVARAALLLACLVAFARVLVLIGSPASARGRALVAGMWFTAIVALRYALLGFHGSIGARTGRLFDPAVFATPALGGILRSTGDLLATGALLLVALYGVTRAVRGGHAMREAGQLVFVAGRERRPAFALLVASVAGAAVVVAMVELCARFVAAVVANANPRLVGETMQLTDPDVLALHVGVFLMLTGIILSGVLAVWGLVRAAGGGVRTLARGVVGTIALVALAGLIRGNPMWFVGIPLAAFIAWAPRYVRREDLVSFVMVAFCLMIVTSIAGYVFLTRNYDALRRDFVQEKTDEMLNPSDNWRVVILEDLLGQYARRPDIRQVVLRPDLPDARRLAFDLWAEGPLSLLGYSCAIHVTGERDTLISRFDVDMPYRPRIGEGTEQIDTPRGEDWAVLDLTRNTPRGIVRFYRGILNVRNMFDGASGRPVPRVAGKVIIDLPFFFENLELAARTGPRTPELLRNVQEGTVAPRVEEPDALLLARVENGRIVESSSSRLAVGRVVPEWILRRAREGRWPLMAAGGATYRVTAREAGADGQFLLAGFSAPSPSRHLLRAATLFSLYLFFAFAIIVVLVVLGFVRPLDRWLPTLVPGRRLGFQQKLLASFLVMALVPAFVLGVFGYDFIRERFVDESRREALGRAFSARKAMVNLLRAEQRVFRAGAKLDSLFAPGRPPVQRVGPDRVVMRFADTADVLQSGPPPISYTGTMHDASPEELFVIQHGDRSYVGVVGPPHAVSGVRWTGSFYLVYARRLDGDFLGVVADEIGADVNVYNEGHLVASSREGLLAGGFVSATMNGVAYTAVSLQGTDHLLTTERAGQYRFQVAYLPVARWGTGDDSGGAGRPVRAALSVPLLFRPESYDREVQRATSVLLGIFALLFTATMALGLFLARGIFEPLRALLAGTRQIAGGRYDVRLAAGRSDEIGTVVGAFNDMTARIAQSRRELEQRRRYLEVILESIGTGVISTDAEGRIRTVNAAAQQIARVSAADVIGRRPGEMAGEGAAVLFELFERHAGERFASGEVPLEREGSSATVKYMLTNIGVREDAAGEGAVLAIEDLTDLIESKKLAAWVEMARQVAHEIKNPLTPIRISTQFMLRAYEQKPEQFDAIFRESTETIMHQVDVLKRIAGEFSSYGRMQKLKVAPRPIGPLVDDIVRAYRNNDAGVEVELCDGGSDVVAEFDAEAVRKICANLIENAFEAMPGGGRIEVRVRPRGAQAGRVVDVMFCDTGPGLDPSVASRLFEPYFSTKTTGTGLGLAICRTLAREMGGNVQVVNAPGGRGVEATLTLRALPDPGDEAGDSSG